MRLGRKSGLTVLQLVAGVLLASLLSACNKAPPPPIRKASAASGSPAPLQVIATLRELRVASAYSKMESLIVAPGAQPVITTLMAVDEFLFANKQLCEYVRNHVGLGLAETIDQSYLAGSLDIFSRYVTLLDDAIDGNTSIVTFAIDDALPARRANLKLVAGRWQYDPGPGFDADLPSAFSSMARGLRQVREDIEQGRLPAATLNENPQRLVEEVRLRLRAGLKLLASP